MRVVAASHRIVALSVRHRPRHELAPAAPEAAEEQWESARGFRLVASVAAVLHAVTAILSFQAARAVGAAEVIGRAIGDRHPSLVAPVTAIGDAVADPGERHTTPVAAIEFAIVNTIEPHHAFITPTRAIGETVVDAVSRHAAARHPAPELLRGPAPVRQRRRLVAFVATVGPVVHHHVTRDAAARAVLAAELAGRVASLERFCFVAHVHHCHLREKMSSGDQELICLGLIECLEKLKINVSR
ncbi:MAG: hypothetical protein AAFP26_07745, partial [Planctomycetota bacterium]